jgi:cellulose synthase/poly-beta-1,6-N-acetylglucosamine synthase-like glycosyltransferase
VPDVSVVIPARDAAATLPRTLAALGAQTLDRSRVEVIVVDDASTDATASIAGEHARVVRLAERAGPGAARNAGVRVASGAVVAFTDADCFPEPGWLEHGLAALAGADLVQGRVVPERPPGRWDRTVRVPGLFGLFETANLLVRRPLLDALGGFEPGWAPLGGKELGEDTWLGWRARRAGARTSFAPDAVVAHAVVPRGRAGYVAERARLVAFPSLVRRIPELRGALCWQRVFLSRRSAAFDAATAGVLAAALTRRRAPLLLALPYLAERPGPTAVTADAVGAAALLAGSIRARSVLL